MTEPTGTDIIHLDMDAFFASVEVLDDPELRGQPVIVGGIGARGVVASASYEARAFGVRSAMAITEARRRCPQAVYLKGRHGRYREVSEQLFTILRNVTPLVETIALDEAFLDVAGAHLLHGSSVAIAEQLRRDVESELRLSCSVGIGRTKLIAKLASVAAKPKVGRPGTPAVGAGVVAISPAEEFEFLHGHSVRALPGVGPSTEAQLYKIGVKTVRDLAALTEAQLVARFGAAHGRGLFALATGHDPRIVVADRATQSIGHEETFARDIRDRSVLMSRLGELATSVIERCREAGLLGRTVQVKVRFGDFTTLTRQATTPGRIESAAQIVTLGSGLLDGLEIEDGVRLLGVSVSGFDRSGVSRAEQLDLFSVETTTPERNQDAEVAADEVRRRFGGDAIGSLARLARRGDDRPRPLD